MSQPPRDAYERAYLELVEKYETAILNYIYRFVGDASTAEDLTQDTYVKAYQARHSLDLDDASEERRRAWLYRIAHNTAADHLRRQARIRWLPLARTHADPAEPEPRALVTAAVGRAMARLSEEHRETLCLFLEADMTATEVGAVLGISSEAARKRLQRARAAFEAAWAECEMTGAGQPLADDAADAYGSS